MNNWLKEYKFYVIGVLLALLAAGYYLYAPDKGGQPLVSSMEDMTGGLEQPGAENGMKEQPEQKDKPAQEEQPQTIMADIKGAVKQPGVYEAKAGERVIDLITRAGGLTDTADESQVNFAMHVEDEMVIYIPAIGEEVEPSVSPAGAPEERKDKININKAAGTELETLPGIGPSKSAAIIEYRETTGPFQTIEDLKLISGFGEKTFEKLKDRISVN